MDVPTVDRVLSRPVETVTPDTTIPAAAATMLDHDVGAVVVLDDSDQLVGLLTVTDVAAHVSEGRVSPDATVGEWMRTDVTTTTPETAIGEVAETMVDRLIHHVPVVDGESVVGMVTTLDLTAHLARSL
ncbi:CBS domain-containing protein [Halobellus rufus]|uniref:CBS domain-containing protein n=1 Tax=Halobellus rufus TaxID=1448860 RepID=UPI0006798DEE|nr:CBS domain-containing protein [Halobellus rufus]